jgi:hypothetical protein
MQERPAFNLIHIRAVSFMGDTYTDLITSTTACAAEVQPASCERSQFSHCGSIIRFNSFPILLLRTMTLLLLLFKEYYLLLCDAL